MNAQEILREVNVCSRPGYYSGRGERDCDLNPQQLLRIHDLIREHHGEDAAKAMVSTVRALEECSATAFILALYALERNGWEYVKPSEQQTYIDQGIGEGGMLAQAFASLAERSKPNKNRDVFPRIKRAGVGDRFIQLLTTGTEDARWTVFVSHEDIDPFWP